MILDILQYPHEILLVKATPVRKPTKELLELASNMLETLKTEKGLGLAAPQVGKSVKLLTMKHNNDKYITMFNPSIVSKSNTRRGTIEQCLSFKDESYLVKRPTWVKVRYLDSNNKQKFIEFKDYDAVVFFHEYAHLLGLTLAQEGTKIEKENGNTN